MINNYKILQILTDWLFKYGAHKAIQWQSKFSPSFLYHFRYKSLNGLVEIFAKTKDSIGIPHGEDVLLIFWNPLRDFPYSKEEAKVGRLLIDLCFNFAKYSVASYGTVQIEESKPNNILGLEIFSPGDYKIKQFGESFGNIKFWDDIESKLVSETRDRDEL